MDYNGESAIPFVDLLFNLLCCFVILFTVSFVLISVEKKKQNIDMKAVYLITVTWPDESEDDVDTYVEDPIGNLVAFMRREQGLMHLDRDDLGYSNDTVKTAFGAVEFKGNREIVTLRGTLPGEYVVNVHMYAMRGEQHETPVSVTLTKINPFSIIAHKTVTLVEDSDEKTAFRFNLDKDGNVENIDDLEKILANRSSSDEGHTDDFLDEEGS
jgi:hypothetical protein